MPPSPKLQTIGSSGGGGGGGGAAEGPLLERLQELLGVPGLRDPYERQQERGRHRLSTQSGSGRVGHGARSAGAVARTQAQAQAQAQGQAAPGPRPYFWRLQQRLQAGAYRPGSGAAGGAWGALQGADGAAAAAPVREEDYVLLWRRQVYDNDLWAVPLGGEAPRLALGSGSARERRLTGACGAGRVAGKRAAISAVQQVGCQPPRRINPPCPRALHAHPAPEWVGRELPALLQPLSPSSPRPRAPALPPALPTAEWVDRELRALLQSNDTVVLRGFVLGLVVAYGLQPFPPPAAAATTASGGASGPVPAAVGPAGGSSAAASAAAAQAARATASRRAAAMVAAAGGGGGGGGGGALGSSPAEALQPFLHEHAPHFWHELRCFAAAPFNIPTCVRAPAPAARSCCCWPRLPRCWAGQWMLKVLLPTANVCRCLLYTHHVPAGMTALCSTGGARSRRPQRQVAAGGRRAGTSAAPRLRAAAPSSQQWWWRAGVRDRQHLWRCRLPRRLAAAATPRHRRCTSCCRAASSSSSGSSSSSPMATAAAAVPAARIAAAGTAAVAAHAAAAAIGGAREAAAGSGGRVAAPAAATAAGVDSAAAAALTRGGAGAAAAAALGATWRVPMTSATAGRWLEERVDRLRTCILVPLVYIQPMRPCHALTNRPNRNE